MLISYKWLKSYVPDLPSPEKVAEVFTFHICEIESTEKLENGDSVFDIKVLPDRAHDLLSHRGVANDLANILNIEYKDIKYEVTEGEPTKLSIKIETENCRRYMGRIIRNVKVGATPDWVKEHLASMRQRSINNLVDATNIVMFDRGNPIHVFDLEKVNGAIIVRQAKEGERIITLDNKEVKLGPNNMVIADEKNILAIAGVKGGKVAEVDENTNNIIIEVANFNPASVRKTSKEINIYTDAVKRYENDLSPEVTEDAMNDMTALTLEMCKDVKIEKSIDVYPKKQVERKLEFSAKKISKILGLEIEISKVEEILKRCQFEYKNNGDIFEIIVPEMRLDLNEEVDMAEEIGRVIGYDKIEAKLPEIKKVSKIDETFYKILSVREKLLADGYSEVMTYSFRDKGEVEVLASASDKKFLRANLTDGLKESLKLNQLNMPFLEMNEIKIFEIGTIFKKDKEEMHVAYGDKKGIKEMSLDEFCSQSGINNFPAFALGDKRTGDRHDSLNYSSQTFKMWSVYPFISRDIAVWLPEGENPEKLKQILIKNGTELLIKEPYLFDSFTKNGKTSYAFRLIFQSYDRTLTDEEVNKIMEKINDEINKMGWEIR